MTWLISRGFSESADLVLTLLAPTGGKPHLWSVHGSMLGQTKGERRPQRCLKLSGSLFAAGPPRIEMAWPVRFDLPAIPIGRRPGFDQDIDALRRYTNEECGRLARHTRLEADRRVPLARECLPALKAAIDGGSLLVIGEPGAGKTGVLVALAQEFLTQTAPFVFLSVDRLAGITKMPDLKVSSVLRTIPRCP
ncbi:MAG: hypothetical protein WDN04_26280 [Rhodospirillales bacterium]